MIKIIAIHCLYIAQCHDFHLGQTAWRNKEIKQNKILKKKYENIWNQFVDLSDDWKQTSCLLFFCFSFPFVLEIN